MLQTKTVAVDAHGMHLWDEANNFICSCDPVAESEMCRFLRMMLDEGIYQLRDRPAGRRKKLAA